MANKLYQFILKLKRKTMYSRAFSVLNYDANCISMAGVPMGQNLLNIPEWHIVMEGNNTWLVSNEMTAQPLADIQMEYQVNGSPLVDFSTSFSFIGRRPPVHL